MGKQLAGRARQNGLVASASTSHHPVGTDRRQIRGGRIVAVNRTEAGFRMDEAAFDD
jgi:hypothetical protein